jgi:hypothetical protein
MRRRLLNIAAGLSLLVCLAVVTLWVRSYSCADEIIYQGARRAVMFRSYAGSFWVIRSAVMLDSPGWGHIFGSRFYLGWAEGAQGAWRVPFVSVFVWTAVLPFWRFLLPWVRGWRARKRGTMESPEDVPH